MTPARSMAASVAALGFAGALAAPLPALAASPEVSAAARAASMPPPGVAAPGPGVSPSRLAAAIGGPVAAGAGRAGSAAGRAGSAAGRIAPARCARAERYAAQAEAELLRVQRLDLRGVPQREHEGGIPEGEGRERPSTTPPESTGPAPEEPGAGTPAPGGGRPPAGSGTTDSAPPSPQSPGGSGGPARPDGPGGANGGPADGPPSVNGRPADGPPDPAGARDGTGSNVSAPVAPPAGRLVPATLGRRPGDRAPLIRGVGVGDARTVMIANAPVKSAAAGLVLNGRAPGAPAAEQVLQQAPPSHPEPTEQHTGPGRFGPLQVGGGTVSAYARWETAMGCGAAGGEISRSATRLDSVTLTGGNGELVRVPERMSSLSSTALNRRGGRAESVASATVNAGRIDLAGGRVRVRVLRAPTLRVGMSAVDGGEVRYRPAVVEVSGSGLSGTRLDAPGDHVDVTLRDLGPVTESELVPVLPAGASPLPSIPGLPAPSTAKSGPPGAGAPAADGTGGVIVRVSLGEARQATKGRALVARATAIKVSVLRTAGAAGDGRKPSTVVADLGIGMLEAAAVTPEPGERSAGAGTRATRETLPITGPPIGQLFITGAGLLAGGLCAFLLGGRQRRRDS
ncbi:hypothetical protein [Actinoplanes teichomyceticus]|uniref:Gram-positive cocci surface proteins LPxTG domain-containing protein n=1 Tax=Actinoplanes teichomyceticus TaxID=1867 RepID=A0A561WSA6_ACTTI|nr:hypothetical protein [Actinoplanes teichomyceticus]TWG26733.1 hypothetical protein FHX34_1011730 [Actinoplanes teichomyceticus]GIF15132.1 hypothetical protein Ate01nite_51640 [Actinoplanes teichomyceticus]